MPRGSAPFGSELDGTSGDRTYPKAEIDGSRLTWSVDQEALNGAVHQGDGAALSHGSSLPHPHLVMPDPRSASAVHGQPLKVRFVNTYRPVIPLYETVASVAADLHGWQVSACMSRGIYRSSDQPARPGDVTFDREMVWIPKVLRGSSVGTNALFSLLAPFRLLGPGRAHVNVFLTHPPLFYVVGGVLSRAQKVPYVVHLMDVYPDILLQAGWLSAEGWVYRYLSGLALRGLERAAGIVVIGRCMQQRLVEKGIDPAKIHLVPTWPSPHIRPIHHSENRFRQRHGLRGKFVVMYSGNMGLPHELGTLLSVAETLVDHAGIRFMFVGAGRRRQMVQAAIDRGLPNVTLLDYQADGEGLAHSLAAADVHFVSLRRGYEGLVVPSKFYGAIAAGRPVIYEGAGNGEVARVIQETGCGIVVDPGDVAGLRAAILALDADGERCHRLGAIAVDLYRERCDPTAVASAYCRAIAQALCPQA